TNSNCTAPQGQQAVTNANGGIAGSGSQIYLEGRTLNNPGVANLNNTSGALTLYYGSVINNLANASWNLPTDFGISVSTGGGTFNNAGTFSKTGGTGTSTIGVAFNNSGVVQANTGALNFQAVGNSTGSWSVANGATLDLAAGSGLTATLSEPISGAGTVAFGPGTNNVAGSYNVTGGTGGFNGTTNFNGTVTNVGPVSATGGILNFVTPLANQPGTVSISGNGVVNFSTGNAITVPSMTLGSGDLVGSDTVNITGLLTWTSSGVMCTTTNCTAPQGQQAVTNANGGIAGSGSQIYLEGRTLNNPGTATLSNNLNVYFGGVINNLATGTWSLSADNGLIAQTGGATFNNFGTLSKTAGTGTSSVSVTFNNTGAVQANTGTINFSAVGNTTGSWSVAGSATL